jgi:uncharacterized alpha/beta hydrolase family protein
LIDTDSEPDKDMQADQGKETKENQQNMIEFELEEEKNASSNPEKWINH